MGQSRRIVLILLMFFATAAHAVDIPKLKQPAWKELTVEQQQVLAPLAPEWDRMEPLRRKKWLGIVARFSDMTQHEQERVQDRMYRWAKLTPEQRKLAREKYKALRKAAPEQKAAVKQRWDAYSELSDEEKLRLQEAARPKPLPKPGTVTRKPPLTPAAAMLMPRTKSTHQKPQLSPAPSLLLPTAPSATKTPATP